ncbi:MAG: K+ channel, inward rectifier [Candidatus Doudnabacteria bacterium]|nr:K+ channel, inward rectifier [Candidatus Doudnabacteria bacterium]
MAEIPQQEDLGLGDKVVQENRTRFLNHDGTFNVHRKGVFDRGNFSPYHAVLNASWWKFNVGMLGYYIVANFIFATLYIMAGRNAFPDIAGMDAAHRFGQVFFYSVQVITTLGTSPLHPANTMADVVLAIEAMVGMIGFAVAASLLFARFSNPPTKIQFSKNAVVAPYHGDNGFMVRIVNGRSNELIHVSAIVTMAMTDQTGRRSFHRLALERDEVFVFPLNWTIVHPIDESSPLRGLSAENLKNNMAEFLVYITAIDQDLSKTIYARSSYRADEVLVGYKFSNIIERDQKGTVVIDPARIGEVEKI